MSKFGLIVWLSAPVLVVALLFSMLDRRMGQPNPALAAKQAARLPGQDLESGRDVATVQRERAETAARAASADAPGAAAAPQPAAPKMVQPETLEQGFIIVVDDPNRVANASNPIYLASSHNGWNPGDPGAKLSPRSDSRWQIVLSKPALDSKMAFKFTRGSWDTVEVAADFKDIENRLLSEVDVSKLAPGEKPVIELTIPAWRDKQPGGATPANVGLNRYRAIAVAEGTLKRVDVAGPGATTRDLLVWLPPGYESPGNASVRYPVLYLMDGQNVFEKLPTIPAEWAADETAGRLIKEGKIRPLIIVGVPSAPERRMREYLPVAAYDGVEAEGAGFVRFLVSEVKPRVDALFRTEPGPESTAVGGASLGGMIALEAATERPDVFGKVLAESTPLLSKDRLAFRHFAAKKSWPQRVYFGMGGKEAGLDPKDAGLNQQFAGSAEAFGELLKGRGLGADRLKVVVDADAVHNEEAWAKRLPGALEFLFPAE